MKAWNVTAPNGAPVYHNGVRSVTEDTVYYSDECSAEYVKESLINHDGYNYDIIVKED